MRVGKYIVIEGHDGTGKSTQVGLIRQKLQKYNIDSIEFHEPAGSPMADEIRNVIKNGSLKRDAMTNLLLFSAARHEIWHKKAISALKNGKWVIASRNYYSTLAYQGYGENLDLVIIENITRQSTDNQYMNPDIAIILDMDDEIERVKRINIRGQLNSPDTFESKDNTFQAKVRQAYLKIAKSRNIPIVSANQTIEEMTNEIWGHVKLYLKC